MGHEALAVRIAQRDGLIPVEGLPGGGAASHYAPLVTMQRQGETSDEASFSVAHEWDRLRNSFAAPARSR